MAANFGRRNFGPVDDFVLGAQLAIDGIATDAAATDDGPEADLSSEPKLEDLERLLNVDGPGFDGDVIAQFLLSLRFGRQRPQYFGEAATDSNSRRVVPSVVGVTG
jgi:hypothetical protein